MKERQFCITFKFLKFSTLGNLLNNWIFLFGTLLLNFAIQANLQIISNVKNAFDDIFYNQFNNLPDLESKCK